MMVYGSVCDCVCFSYIVNKNGVIDAIAAIVEVTAIPLTFERSQLKHISLDVDREL